MPHSIAFCEMSGGKMRLPILRFHSTRTETHTAESFTYIFGNAIIETGRRRPTVAPPNPLFLPRPLLTLHHHSPQYPVDARLVTRPLRLEPVHHFGIHAQRNPPLPWTVPARPCTLLLLRQKQQIVLNRGPQLDHLPRPPLS